MSEMLLSLDKIEYEVKRGQSLILAEPVRDAKFNVLIGTEKILTDKDIQKIRERCPEWVVKPILVKTAIPHYIEEDKRVKWAAFVVSFFQNDPVYKDLAREKKDFVSRYLKSILLESDYLVWKLSMLKNFSPKVFNHTLRTTYISLIIYSGYSAMHQQGMLDARMIEKVISVAILHNLGLTKTDAKKLEKKRIELAPDHEDEFYQHPIEAYKLVNSEKGKHELPDDVLEAILDVEEFIDGSGGPRGIRGEDLTLLARVVSLSSYFSQLISGEWAIKDRPLKEYIAKIRSEKTKFDPNLVESLEISFKYFFTL